MVTLFVEAGTGVAGLPLSAVARRQRDRADKPRVSLVPSRTNIDIDDELAAGSCAGSGLTTKRAAVDLAPTTVGRVAIQTASFCSGWKASAGKATWMTCPTIAPRLDLDDPHRHRPGWVASVPPDQSPLSKYAAAVEEAARIAM